MSLQDVAPETAIGELICCSDVDGGRRRRGWLRWWPLAIPVLLAILLQADQLLRPGYLLGVTSWDDGVYVGQVLRLLDGVVPYRDYPAVEPPGLMLLLAPFVAIGRHGGTDAALATARVVTAMVEVADVLLLGFLLRHRGRLSAGFAMGFMALYPGALASSFTVLLEPYLNLFCLLGIIAIFPNGRLGSGRRLAAGGACLGLAGTIKIFAVFPLIGLIIFLMWRHREALRRVVLGAVLGFGAVCLPFIALAPGAFLRQVVWVQMTRSAQMRVPTNVRLTDIVGTSVFSLPGAAVLVFDIAALALIALILVRSRRQLLPVEAYCAITSLVIIGSLFIPATFINHYAAFVAPYLLVPAAAVLPGALRSMGPRVPVVCAVGVAGFASFQLLGDASAIAGAAPPHLRPGPLPIPSGACVLTDSPAYLIVADRFASSRSCPLEVDTFGATMVWDGGKDPAVLVEAGGDPPVVGRWEQIIGKADYFIRSDWPSPDLPITSSFSRWFDRTFVLAEHLPGGGGSLYRHRAAPQPQPRAPGRSSRDLTWRPSTAMAPTGYGDPSDAGR